MNDTLPAAVCEHCAAGACQSARRPGTGTAWFRDSLRSSELRSLRGMKINRCAVPHLPGFRAAARRSFRATERGWQEPAVAAGRGSVRPPAGDGEAFFVGVRVDDARHFAACWASSGFRNTIQPLARIHLAQS